MRNPEADIRVLHFGRFWSENFGGLERHVMTLLQELATYPGVRADNLVASDRRRSDILEMPGFRVYRAGSLGTLSSTAVAPLLPLVARRLVMAEQYNLAHLHYPDPLSTLCAYLLPRRVKIVIGWHGDIIRPLQRKVLALCAPYFNGMLRRASVVVAGTPRHFSSSTQLSTVENARRVVVPYGLHFESLRATPAITAAAARLRERYGPRKIIFAVGRHIYYKGFAYLVRAMAGLDDAVLVLGGRGPLSEELRRLAGELGLTDRIVFPGRIPDEELVHHYHACDIFCMPSVEQGEGFGYVQVEAMASGKPVVCCELQNGVTYVNRDGETGLVVPPRDPDALRAALRRLIQDPDLRERLGQQARDRVLGEFAAADTTRRMVEVYRRVLDEKQPIFGVTD